MDTMQEVTLNVTLVMAVQVFMHVLYITAGHEVIAGTLDEGDPDRLVRLDLFLFGLEQILAIFWKLLWRVEEQGIQQKYKWRHRELHKLKN